MEVNSIIQYYNTISNISSQINTSKIYDVMPQNSSLTQIGEVGLGTAVGTGFVYLMQTVTSKLARLGAVWAGGKLVSETCDRLSNVNNATCTNWTEDLVCLTRMASQGIACTGSTVTNLFFDRLPLPNYESLPAEIPKIVWDHIPDVSSRFLIPASLIGGIGGPVVSGLYFLKSAGAKTLHLGAVWAGERALFEACDLLTDAYNAHCQNWNESSICMGEKGAAILTCGLEAGANLYLLRTMTQIAAGLIPAWLSSRIFR